MERRDVLLGAGAFAATLLAQAARADDDHAAHEHMHHGAGANAALVAAASDCTRTAQVCMEHCLRLFADGITTTAACANSVNQVLPVCQALGALAAANSPHLGQYAKVAAQLCRDCEKECRKHEKEHDACKSCADSCAACATECDKVSA